MSDEASNTSSVHFFTKNKEYYSLIFLQFLCHTYQLQLEPAKKLYKVVKS